MNKNETYALFLKEEKRRQETRFSVYFKNHQNEKTCGPVDIDGYRKKLDFETGEIRDYTRKECEWSSYVSIERSKRCLDMLLEMNDFDWFCTLTFDKEKILRDSDAAVYDAYVKFINNISHQFPTLRYITVLERHEDGNIHFHMVIGGVSWQKLGLVNSGKVCAHWATRKNGICSQAYYNRTKHLYVQKDTDGLPVYNVTSFIYGYTTATRIASREKCNSYIKKYIDKALGSTDCFKKRFYYSENLRVPNVVRRCIGAGFDTPSDEILKKFMFENNLFRSAESSFYLKDYNIGFCTVDNDTIDNISRGLVPTKETTPFD